MDNVLALHPVAPGSNPGRDIFSLLLSLRTVLRSDPSSAKSRGFRKFSAAKIDKTFEQFIIEEVF